MALTLFGWAFLSTVAVAVIPHEPAVIWFGKHWGIWRTALWASAGTATASVVDHRLFGRWIARTAHRPILAEGSFGWIRRWFAKAPFMVMTLSGMTPLPAAPFKVAALAERYPLARYVAAMTLGRFPRYLLLAWFGVALSLPDWVFVAMVAVFLLPSAAQGVRHLRSAYLARRARAEA